MADELHYDVLIVGAGSAARMAEELPRRTDAELWDELMRVTANQSDQQMLQIYVSESYRTVRWLASKGRRLRVAGP